MTYTIPDELIPYLEYIPDDMLSDVITDALRAAIFADPVKLDTTSTQHVDMSQLVELLRNSAGTESAKQVLQKLDNKNEKESVTTIVATSASAEDVDEDLLDIVGNFTQNLFR